MNYSKAAAFRLFELLFLRVSGGLERLSGGRGWRSYLCFLNPPAQTGSWPWLTPCTVPVCGSGSQVASLPSLRRQQFLQPVTFHFHPCAAYSSELMAHPCRHCRSFCRFPPFFPFSHLTVGRPVQSCPRLGPNDPAADPAAGRSPDGAPARPGVGHDRRDGTGPPGVRLAHEPYYGEGSACTCARECLRLRARARALIGTGPPSGGSVGSYLRGALGSLVCWASYTYLPGNYPCCRRADDGACP